MPMDTFCTQDKSKTSLSECHREFIDGSFVTGKQKFQVKSGLKVVSVLFNGFYLIK